MHEGIKILLPPDKGATSGLADKQTQHYLPHAREFAFVATKSVCRFAHCWSTSFLILKTEQPCAAMSVTPIEDRLKEQQLLQLTQRLTLEKEDAKRWLQRLRDKEQELASMQEDLSRAVAKERRDARLQMERAQQLEISCQQRESILQKQQDETLAEARRLSTIISTLRRDLDQERQESEHLRKMLGDADGTRSQLGEARALITAQQQQIEMYRRAISALQEETRAQAQKSAAETAAADQQRSVAALQLERVQQLERKLHEREAALQTAQQEIAAARKRNAHSRRCAALACAHHGGGAAASRSRLASEQESAVGCKKK